MVTECPHCPRKFGKWREYAEHIIEKHSDDEIRVRWARASLNPEPEPESQKKQRKILKFRGKSLDRVPPSRRHELPGYLRKQLDAQEKESRERGYSNMKTSMIEAKTLPEAWFLCVRECMNGGYEYTNDRGSFAGQKRKEFDFVAVHVEYPGSRPLVPDTPIGVPPPATMEYVEEYLPYLMVGTKRAGELYTYGEDVGVQLPEVIKMYKESGHNINQACISVGNRDSIKLEHSQCLRLIDTRVRYGKLHFFVYFRSWDLWAGFPSNLAAMQLLKEYVASEIGVEDGELFAFSKGLHLYDHCWKLADTVLGR